MIEYFVIAVIAFAIGYIIGREIRDSSPMIGVLTNQVEHLQKEIEYYKDLCLWHVEEKEKIKQEHYIK